LPAGAFAFAYFLVLGAKLYEQDARRERLKDVADLMNSGSMTNFGKLVATLVPQIFERIFGSKPFSWKFISRSCLATTIFWIILLSIRNPNPEAWQIGTFYSHRVYNTIFLFSMYVVDWISLIKARLLIRVIIARHYTLAATLRFVCIDVAVSYLLPFVLLVMLSFTPVSPGYRSSNYIQTMFVEYVLRIRPLRDYLLHHSENIHFLTVAVPTTLLTSAWTILLLTSTLVAMLLISIDHIFYFTAWWFRDFEKRPLTSIAKVAGTLIIIVAVVIQAVRSFET
jgi:hypothetical protein